MPLLALTRTMTHILTPVQRTFSIAIWVERTTGVNSKNSMPVTLGTLIGSVMLFSFMVIMPCAALILMMTMAPNQVLCTSMMR